jgi:ribosomal protein S18 acetylase RimI-like enzyme
VRIEAIDPSSYDDAIDGLAALLVDAVEGGAAVNFLAGVAHDEAAAWWEARSEAVRAGAITVFVARGVGDGDDAERIVGSTLLERSRNQNSPHRAEIGKVIVHRSVRRRGIATALMRAAEEQARAEGRWMLVLDTVTGSPASALYEGLGWQTVGTIPGYALSTAGEPEAATYYYKDLR